MDRKHEKALATLGDEQLSAVSGGFASKSKKKWGSYPSYPTTITKTLTLSQSNLGLNFVGGDGQAMNEQSNSADIKM